MDNAAGSLAAWRGAREMWLRFLSAKDSEDSRGISVSRWSSTTAKGQTGRLWASRSWKERELPSECVMDNAFKPSSAWRSIGKLPLRESESPNSRFAKQDALTGALSIYWEDTAAGTWHEEAATLEECAGLETAAVWSANHIEDRLRDHFAGQPNKWVASMRSTRPPSRKLDSSDAGCTDGRQPFQGIPEHWPRRGSSRRPTILRS